MDHLLLLLCVLATHVHTREFCEKSKIPLEMGVWKHFFKHMDSAVVENKPVSMTEGQVYVYENYFPGHTIKYIHVDNLAVKTCGASATIKSGGVGTSTLLIILHADTNQEIRSVIDIWGVENPGQTTVRPVKAADLKNMKSMYLFKDFRSVSHNNKY